MIVLALFSFTLFSSTLASPKFSAVRFWGDQGTVVILSPTHLNLETVNLSLAFWFKTERASIQGVLEKGEYGNPEKYSFRILMDNGRLQFCFRVRSSVKPVNNSYKIVCSPFTDKAFNDGEWHFYVATYDGERISQYVDGRLSTTRWFDSPEPNRLYDNKTWSIYINTPLHERSGYYFGDIANLRMFSTALRSFEVREMYHRGIDGEYANTSLEGLWFTEPNSVRDLTGNENDGVIRGTVRWVGVEETFFPLVRFVFEEFLGWRGFSQIVLLTLLSFAMFLLHEEYTAK